MNTSVLLANPIMPRMGRTPMTYLRVSVLALFGCAGLPVSGTEVGPGDDLVRAVATLEPGEELLLRGGRYRFDENVTLIARGTVGQPITIRAKPGERPVIEQATDRHNVVDIRSSSHLILRGLEFTGGSHGIRLIDSSFVTIEECEVYETGDVAISANAGGTYEGLKFLRNHIHHTNGTGEGLYLGCNLDECRVINSVIESNYIHHTNRWGVTQGDGIEIKEGSFGNVIRDNVVHDTKYPGILLFGTVGNGPANVVERNVIWGVDDNTMQIAADAVVRNNIILGNVSLQPHQSASPSNISFVNNTVISRSTGLAVRGVSGSVLIANNAIYARRKAIRLVSGALDQVLLVGNVGEGGLVGSSSGYLEGGGLQRDFVSASYRGGPPADLFPTEDSALVGAGVASYMTSFDFNGRSREGSVDVGAYRYRADGNPGWVIAAGFKNE